MRLISTKNFEYFRPQQSVFLSCLSLLKQQEARDENQSDLVKSFKDSLLIFNWRDFKLRASFVRRRLPFAPLYQSQHQSATIFDQFVIFKGLEISFVSLKLFRIKFSWTENNCSAVKDRAEGKLLISATEAFSLSVFK